MNERRSNWLYSLLSVRFPAFLGDSCAEHDRAPSISIWAYLPFLGFAYRSGGAW